MVIGILIALQINNWNERRKMKVTEIKALNDIRSGLVRDKYTLDYIYDKHQRAFQNCDSIINVMEGLEEINKLTGKNFAAVNYYTNFYATKGAYESLKTIGFEIISNDTIRFETINLYEQWYSILQTNLDKHAGYILGSATLHQNLFDKFSMVKKDDSSVGFFYEGEMIPIDMISLLKNPQYTFFVKSMKESHQAIIGLVLAMQRRVNRLFHEIEEEIDLLSEK